MKGSSMGKSTILARLVAVCAVAAVAGGVLAGVPVSAQAPDAPSSSVATPRTSVASPAAVRGNGVTPRGDVVWTCLRIKVAGVSAGGRASVTVTGTKANKLYSKVINRSKTLRVAPGVYRVTAARVAATGGTDVPKVETKMLRVRKNRCTGFTVRYQFVPSGPIALPQTITFTQPADTAVNAGPVALSATATSGLTVTFASTTTGVCTVSGASVTLVVAGVCTINADQVGNSTFAAAPQVQRSFLVSLVAQTITFTSSAPAATVGGATYTPTASASSGLSVALSVDGSSADVCSISSGAVSFQTVGPCVINANQGGDANYLAAAQVQQTVTVGAGAQTIMFTQPADTAVNAGPVALSATATSGLTVTFASTTTGVCTVSGASVTLVVAGVCTINADQVGNSTFAAAPQVQRWFAVTPPPGTVGATGPGGGKIFYVDMDRPDGSQRFEAAPDAWNGGVDPSAEWGCYLTEIPGAGGLVIGDGEVNTTAIVNPETGCPTEGIAARLADGYSNAGQTDWFLPSQDELNQLCKYAWGYTSAGAAIPGGQSVTPAQQGELCSVLPPNVLQEPGFSAGTYWSSSQDPPTLENPENPDNNALCQGFGNGVQCPDVKTDINPFVRPIRAF